MTTPRKRLVSGCLVSGWIWLALTLFALPFGSIAKTAAGVGFQPVNLHDPVSGDDMPGLVFYPSTEPGQTTWRGPYELRATPGAPVAGGRKPLVVISHGHGGTDLGHHDLAVYLATHGFIVATLEHPKDNFNDMSGTGTAAVLVGRPVQVKATITAVLGNPRWNIDPTRIGVVGFSAGGYAALMTAGAVPRFERFIGYCRQQPQDDEICEPMNRAKSGSTVKSELAALQYDLHRWGDPADPRVKAAFAMAPLGLLFDAEGLSHVQAPVFLYVAQDDLVLLPTFNALHVAPLLGSLRGIKTVPKAGHYVFLSPCSPRLTQVAAAICKDPAGVDRLAVHRQLNADALAFFNEALQVQTPP